MTIQDIFLFSAFAVMGWLRVPPVVLVGALLISSIFIFVQVHSGSGPFGLFAPRIEASFFTVTFMAVVHLAIFYLARVASLSIRR